MAAINDLLIYEVRKTVKLSKVKTNNAFDDDIDPDNSAFLCNGSSSLSNLGLGPRRGPKDRSLKGPFASSKDDTSKDDIDPLDVEPSSDVEQNSDHSATKRRSRTSSRNLKKNRDSKSLRNLLSGCSFHKKDSLDDSERTRTRSNKQPSKGKFLSKLVPRKHKSAPQKKNLNPSRKSIINELNSFLCNSPVKNRRSSATTFSSAILEASQSLEFSAPFKDEHNEVKAF